MRSLASIFIPISQKRKTRRGAVKKTRQEQNSSAGEQELQLEPPGSKFSYWFPVAYYNEIWEFSRLNSANVLSHTSGSQKSEMSLTVRPTLGWDHGVISQHFSRLKCLFKALKGNPFSFQLPEAIWGFPEVVARGGNGIPLQYPCLENPMGGGAW